MTGDKTSKKAKYFDHHKIIDEEPPYANNKTSQCINVIYFPFHSVNSKQLMDTIELLQIAYFHSGSTDILM